MILLRHKFWIPEGADEKPLIWQKWFFRSEFTSICCHSAILISGIWNARTENWLPWSRSISATVSWSITVRLYFGRETFQLKLKYMQPCTFNSSSCTAIGILTGPGGNREIAGQLLWILTYQFLNNSASSGTGINTYFWHKKGQGQIYIPMFQIFRTGDFITRN